MRNELYDSRNLDEHPVDDDQDGKFSSLDGAADQLDSVQDPNSHASPIGIDEFHGADPLGTQESYEGETDIDDETGESGDEVGEAGDPLLTGETTAEVEEEAPTPPPREQSYHWPGSDPGGVEERGS